MKLLLSVICCLVFAQFTQLNEAQGASEASIGVVDMQSALLTVDAGKKAKAQLEQIFNQQQKDLKAEEDKIRKEESELQKQSLVLSEEARGKKQAHLQAEIMKFQEMRANAQMKMQTEEAKVTEPIVHHLQSVIGELAKKYNYTMVLPKSVMLYFDAKDDITKEVISIANGKGTKK